MSNYFSNGFTFFILKKNIVISLCSHALDINFSSDILGLLSITNRYNTDVTLQ